MRSLPSMRFVDFWLVAAILPNKVRLVAGTLYCLDRGGRYGRGFDPLEHHPRSRRGQVDTGRLDAWHGGKRLLDTQDT